MVKPAGQKKSRKYRRGRGENRLRNIAAVKQWCVLYHLNIRCLNSNRKSFEIILSHQIITLNETALRFKQKPKLVNFISFNRNRSNQIMGGVASFEKIKDNIYIYPILGSTETSGSQTGISWEFSGCFFLSIFFLLLIPFLTSLFSPFYLQVFLVWFHNFQQIYWTLLLVILCLI